MTALQTPRNLQADPPPDGPSLPTTLSPSKLSSFTDCALAFRFSAIDRLPEPPSVAAVRGTAVHEALQGLFHHPSGSRSPDVALTELAGVRDRWQAGANEEWIDLQLSDGEAEQFWSDSADLTRAYFTLEDPDQVNAVGLEVMMATQIQGTTLRGIIDRLDFVGPGQFEVVDYKTGRAPSERYERSRLDGVKIYAALCESMLGVAPTRVRLLYLGGDQPQALSIDVNERITRMARNRAEAAWTTVERAHAADAFKPRSGPLCNWCSFQAYCPEFGGDPDEARALGLQLRHT